MIKIITAEHMSFCAGVARAVDTAYEMAGKNCVTFGPIIHNRNVTDDLAQKGVRIINDLDELENDETVIIRAHGVPLDVEEEMKRRGISYIDRTCPHVKSIHRCAEKSQKDKRILIVLGQACHPEVIGICGYGGSWTIVTEGDISGIDPEGRYTLVVQTTYNQEIFDEVAEVLVSSGIDVEIHNTICNATTLRQQEAERISKLVDCMIVLGDENSANTRKMFEISQKNCSHAILSQSIQDIQLQDLSIYDRIGITAGASTPPTVTKEAILFMSDFEKNPVAAENEIVKEGDMHSSNGPDIGQPENQSFQQMLDESFVTLHTGDAVKGTVIQVTSSEITVNLGYKSDGIITKNEFTDDANADLTALAAPGDIIEVLVMRVNDGDGNVLVSKRRLDAQANFKLIEQAFNDKTPVEGRITDLVKGGLIANIFGNRVFVPSSQISNRYVEDLSSFKGKTLQFTILEYDRSKRRIVAGRRELAAQEQKARREELFASLEIGQKLEGKVSRITDFGAFIDLGGVDGLVHISELAWRRVRKVADVLSVGEDVVVTVIDINPEKNKISLTLKDINNNPWNNVAEKYPIDSLIEGKVVRMATFGAFVNLEDGIDGLVHVSQISNKHVAKPEDELSVGQVITVKVTDVDEENKKISLSKKLADAELRGGDDDYDDYYDDEDYDEEDYMEQEDTVEGDDMEEEDAAEGDTEEEAAVEGDVKANDTEKDGQVEAASQAEAAEEESQN